jgi:hypothetical protein
MQVSLNTAVRHNKLLTVYDWQPKYIYIIYYQGLRKQSPTTWTLNIRQLQEVPNMLEYINLKIPPPHRNIQVTLNNVF